MLRHHLEKLIYFHSIAANGSFLSAAQALRISQPALSKSMKILEENLNAKLFIRHRRGIELNEAGEVLYSYVERLLTEIDDIETQLSLPHSLSGHLRVGTFETLGITFWPQTLRSLARAAPELKISLLTSSPQEHWNRLDNESIHFIVDAEPPLSENYYSKILYDDSFGLYVSPSYEQKSIIPDFSYVTRAYDQRGESVQTALQRLKIDHRLEYDVDTFVAVKELVKAGLAVGVLPLSFAAEAVKNKSLVEYPSKDQFVSFGRHRICATCLEKNRRDPRLQLIFKTLKERTHHL